MNQLAKRIIVSLLCGCALVTAASSESRVTGVYFVDMEAAFQESSASKMQKLQNTFEKKQATLASEHTQLEEEARTFEKNAATMPASVRESTQQTIREKAEALSAKRAKLSQDQYQSENEIRSAFIQSVSKASKEIAQKKGINLILPKQVVLFAEADLDLTAEVLKVMN
ncbi:OmpH family outer membrane protein [Candidatus Comchoanobacter bicostacola]|uniref:OmpH family outer membrane protein n=1 Tax=Candidatus Comchoanobacter bicostacola TaxID=2919598 RepID=A0ABY5DM78_9GAMM|nr:OmpH family outer membrane protein [Candidatus Comchoanobacter bicostacola]UTC24664.1 OmpH family outer membrane protein [Candidatus Comchoanobacter bicostacola]